MHVTAIEGCNARKLIFNGGYNCTGNSDSYSCSLNCPEGIPFEFQPAPVYTCQYSTGQFLPSPIPQCIFDDNMQVINLGGDSHSTFEIFNKTSAHGTNTGSMHGFSNVGFSGTVTHNYFGVTSNVIITLKIYLEYLIYIKYFFSL